MRRRASLLAFWAGCIATLSAVPASAQQPPAPSALPPNGLQIEPGQSGAGGQASTFMQVPVTSLFPGGVNPRPPIKNPVAGDPQAPERGMRYFEAFNCAGCHAANGGGGMGPALSNNLFIYGGQPENIYLSIYQGRPNGMPAWGGALPSSVIWDLVTYIQNLSNEPSSEWGTRVSRSPQEPRVQQLPAEISSTPKPWSQTQPFGNGQKPQ
jgi:cytochrome c oxidase cbb3-type subunit 3